MTCQSLNRSSFQFRGSTGTKMKLLLFFLPLAFAVPVQETDKRGILDNILHGHIFNTDEVKHVVTQLFNTLGTDETEQACEKECDIILHADHYNLLQYACSPICRSFQSLVHHFGLSSPVDPQAVGKREETEKRGILDNILHGHIFNTDEVKHVVTQLFNTLGTDETEQACEKECDIILHADHYNLLQYACSPICRSFQSLVHHFGLSSPVDPQAVGKREDEKRMLLDTFGNLLKVDELQKVVTQIFDQLGNNATEKACEAECGVVIHADHVLRFSCPLICRSFQSLVQHFNVHPTGTPAKRSIFDQFSHIFNGGELQLLIKQIADTAGSNATEQACESSCHKFIQQDHLLQFGCPLVCRSFQELVHHFKITPTSAKRGLLDSLNHIFNGDELKHLAQQLLDTVGSDATEQACESKCRSLIHQDHLLQFACPLTCHSFQEVVHHFNLKPDNATMPSAPTKRAIWDNFLHTDELKLLVTQLFNTLGSDATEQACENECGLLVHQDHILRFACPLCCHSFQSLVQHFGLSAPTDPAAVGKRSILDTLEHVVHVDELKNLVNQLHTLLGSDESEVLCESECRTLVHQEHVLYYACPLVCHSLQELLHHFNSAVGNTNPPAPTNEMQRRMLFTDLFSSPEIKPLVEQLYNVLGSDESEANCERHCVPIALNLPDHGAISQYACPFVCNSFQSLLHKFDIHTLTGPGTGAVAPATGTGSGSPSS